MIFENKCPSFARQVSLSPLNPFRKHSGSPLSPKTTYVLREQTTSADAKSKVVPLSRCSVQVLLLTLLRNVFHNGESVDERKNLQWMFHELQHAFHPMQSPSQTKCAGIWDDEAVKFPKDLASNIFCWLPLRMCIPSTVGKTCRSVMVPLGDEPRKPPWAEMIFSGLAASLGEVEKLYPYKPYGLCSLKVL